MNLYDFHNESFQSGLPELAPAGELPERVQRAARAAGVFQEVSDPDQLHVWGKKCFIESFLVWEEIEENQLLLPDGDLKNLLAGVAAAKALPASIAPLPEPAAYSYAPAIAAAGKSEQADRKMAAKAAVPIRETHA